MQSQRRDLELSTVKNKHDNINRYEENFENNKRNLLANLQKINRSNTLEAKRTGQPHFNQTFKTGFLKRGDLMNESPMKTHEMMSKTIVGNMGDLKGMKTHLDGNNQKELERIL